MLLITGANGQLGRSLQDILGENALYTDAAELDITDEQAVRRFGQAHSLKGVVNCAAYTQVDKAEEEPELARRINALGPANLAKMAGEQNIPLIHISTDYVFDGRANVPISEVAATGPLGVYGRTKLEGENNVLKYAATAVVLRTAWLYSPYGKNFLKTMLALGKEKPEIRVVADQFGTPTYAAHLAQAVLGVLSKLRPGTKEIYHFTDEGTASWYDFAQYIFNVSHAPCRVRPVLTKDYPTRAARPAFSVLDKTKIKRDFGLDLPHWTKGVEECLSKLS